MRTRTRTLVALLLLLNASCRRAEQGTFVTAPFNDATRLARVDARWQVTPTGLHFQILVENRLADRLFVRLAQPSFRDADGNRLGGSDAGRGCVLAPHASDLVLDGDVALSAADANRVASFDVERFGVPLSDRGRGIYREFLLQQRVRTPAAIDEELARYAAAPPCG